MTENNLLCCDDHIMHNHDAYTYHHESLGHTSFTDHFLVSPDLFDRIQSGNILDSGVNLSDHLCISMYLTMPVSFVNSNSGASVVSRKNSADDKSVRRLRWDRADLSYYYNESYNALCAIDITALLPENASNFSVTMIDELCVKVVDCLNYCANLCIPKTTSGFFKHWWNVNLTTHYLPADYGKLMASLILDRFLMLKDVQKHGINRH